MSYLALARRWRPRDFADVVGQEHVVRALSHALDSERVHHAYLFSGTRGVGKTTLARILAKALNCETGVSSKPCGECSACQEIDSGRFVDLLEVDAASRTRVDDTRELLDNVQYTPARGRFKVYLIDEVHMLSNHSFNALLKTLEEPPPHVKFLLATTDPQKLPVTVLSRCLQFNLTRLPATSIVERMEEICSAEGTEFDSDSLAQIARSASGSMRDALSILDQAIAYGGGTLRASDVRAMLGTVERGRVAALLERVAAGDGPGLLAEVEIFGNQVSDLGSALDEVAGMLQQIAVFHVAGAAALDPEEDISAVESLAQSLDPEWTQLLYQIALHGRRDLHLAPDTLVGFRMALLRMIAFAPLGLESYGPSANGPENARPASDTGDRKTDDSAGTTAKGARATHDAASAGEPEITGKPVPPPVEKPISSSIGEVRPAVSDIDTTDWPSILRSLRLDGAALQLAEHCALAQLSPFDIQLLLEKRHELLLTDRSRRRLSEALEQRLGQGLRLDVRICKDAGETLAARAARQKQETLDQARASIEDDPQVRELIDTFGASVDPKSVRPRDVEHDA
jgi:DNA polymerase-3 subunit gamma/tau